MNLLDRAAKLGRPASSASMLAVGLLILALVHGLRLWVQSALPASQATSADLDEPRDALAQGEEDLQALKDFRARDQARLKSALAGRAKSRRAMFDAAFAMEDEHRLLQKQWEIISTYLVIDEQAGKVLLMQGDQALQSFVYSYNPPKVFVSGKPLPELLRIVSKERFAHPERGRVEEVDGKLQWEPPQVGTSVRANALGEFVVFTDGDLILHGPPKKAAEHQAFAHTCLGLSLWSAKRLYDKTFIGTRILIRQAPQAAPATQAAPAPPLAGGATSPAATPP